ncbi:MAG: VCBS repeat-containing protein [Planctomycetes bacterium]|jgi:hypothetical protein|nr:VCBS repeat-containing protein [Planctomycetota bacterium]
MLKSLVVTLIISTLLPSQQVHSVLDAPVVAVDGWSRIDELLDLDLDGDLDGFGLYLNRVTGTGQPTFMEAKLHRNDGAGRFTSSIVYSWTSSPGQPTTYRSAVGDVDGDGNADVVTLRGGEVRVVESRPGQPVVRVLTGFGSNSFALACGAQLRDVTGDGKAELIVVDTSNGLRVINLNATTWTQRGIATPTAGSTELALLEANGNGLIDAVVLYGSQLVFYEVTTPGGMVPFLTRTLPVGISNFGSLGHLVAGDVDGDGDTDVVVFGGAGQYALVERTGPAQFLVRPAAVGGPATNLHDFDGDGDLDGTCCGGGTGSSTTSPNDGAGNFEIAENLGGGVFAPSWRMPSVGPFHLAGCADVDGDGAADLVGGRCVYFGRRRHDPVPVVLPSAYSTRAIDVDRDDDPDLVVGASQWTNRGNGVFDPALLPLPALPPAATWQVRGRVDFDGDGDSDVLAHRLVMGVHAASHLLRNAGGGHVVDAGPVMQTPMVGSDPLLAGDFDGDGDLDVIAVDGVASSQLWWQVGGALVLGRSWPGARVVGVADFTGDGRTDVLVATYPFAPSTGTMNLALESFDGVGSFVSQTVGQFIAMDAIGIVDHNGDGWLDLVVSEYTNSQSQLLELRNNGFGQFSPASSVAGVSLRPRARIVAADVDGDGRHDLVAGPAGYPDAPNGTTGVWVVRQPSSQVFLPVLYANEFGHPVDVDGDGDVDLLGRAILRNTRFDGAVAGVREQFGTAIAGSGGARPTIHAAGPFRVGANITTGVRGGVGQGLVILLASLQPATPPTAPIPGFSLYLEAPIVLDFGVLSGGFGAAGEGSASFLPLLLPPAAAGLTICEQALVFDAAGIAPGLTHTQGLRLLIGQ